MVNKGGDENEPSIKSLRDEMKIGPAGTDQWVDRSAQTSSF